MIKKAFWLLMLSFSIFTGTAQNYVTLYENCNYSGRSYTLEPGNYRLYQMKISNDQLSSIRIPDRLKVTIYENDNFGGRSKIYTTNNSCLESGWNDAASSIVVESEYDQPGYGQGDYVTFYENSNSRGFSQSLRIGRYTGSQLGNLRYNISSFVINGSLRVKAYLNSDNLTGYSVVFDESKSYLPDNQNDKIGSLIIEYNPNSPGNGGGNNNTGNYATFYEDCNYQGNALRLMPGYYSGEKLGILKYNIASAQIPSNLRVKVFINNDNLYGQSSTLTNNNTCLDYNLKDRIGSLVVEERGGYGGGGGGNNPGNETVIIYSDENYKGQSAVLLPGTYNTMSQASGFPDNSLSSLKVPPGYRVVLYEFANLQGKSYTITNDKTGFSISGWNDKTSSIVVYRD